MNLLLDTHIVLWFLANDPELSDAARLAILDLGNARWVSPISLLEILRSAAARRRIGLWEWYRGKGRWLTPHGSPTFVGRAAVQRIVES